MTVAKHVSGIGGVLQCFPGRRIAQIANKIDNNTAALEPYDYVLIHVGTNDIGDRSSYQNILSDYGNLTDIVRKKKRSIIEPHVKTNKMSVCPAKTQISLSIRPVWSESLPCAQWVANDPRFLHGNSEDSDQTGRMLTHFVGFVMSRLNYNQVCNYSKI